MFVRIFWIIILGLIIFAVMSRRKQNSESAKRSPRVDYLYFASFVSLVVVACSLSYILGIGIESVISSVIFGVDEKKALSLAFAFLIVSFPIWLYHWHRTSFIVDQNQSSELRTFREKYLYVVLGFSGLVFLVFAGWVLYKIFNKMFGITDFDKHFFSRFLGYALTNLGIWFYHWFLARNEPAKM